MKKKSIKRFSKEEVAQRMERTMRAALSTPPKPRSTAKAKRAPKKTRPR